MGRAILAELFGVIDKGIGLDDRRIVLVFVIAVEPGQDDFDGFLVGGLEFFAGPGRQIDVFGESGRAAGEHRGSKKTSDVLNNNLPSRSRVNISAMSRRQCARRSPAA